MKLRAFNLIPGLVIHNMDDEDLVVIEVKRDPQYEMVIALVRHVAHRNHYDTYHDYCDEVEVVGVTVNKDDPDDDDFGTRTTDKD